VQNYLTLKDFYWEIKASQFAMVKIALVDETVVLKFVKRSSDFHS
jgi:hypothetical protein